MQFFRIRALTNVLPGSERFARNWHRLLLAMGCTLVLLLLVSSHWQANASLRALANLQQQAQRVEHLDDLLIKLMDAENAVRGYLLSGNRTHLEPYKANLATLDATLRQIRADLGADPDASAALDELAQLVQIKRNSLEKAVAAGRPGLDTRPQGKRHTDLIRNGTLALQAHLAAQGQRSFRRSTHHVQRTRWVVVTLAGCALLLMATLLLVVERQFTLRARLADLLQSENQRLETKVQQRTAELTDLASYLTNAREAEKTRLARELHDELGALLTGARMAVDWISRQLDAANRTRCQEHLARLDTALAAGIALKRRIIDNLCPPLLEQLGLIDTLRVLGAKFTQEGSEHLTLDLPDADIDAPPALALAVYRIAQESLTNIRKHAHATSVKLALRIDDGQLELRVEDNGTGFQPGPARGRHHGLAGMRHRAQMCGGSFELQSRPSAGTRIIACLPLNGGMAGRAMQQG